MGLFQRKVRLIELLNGANDMHNHILPGIDDGAQNIDESIELVRMYKDIGITELYATPHTMSDYYPNTPETIKAALEKLNKALAQSNLSDVKISPSSEYMVDHDFEELVEKDLLLPLKGKHVLIEMSYLKASENFDEAVYKLQLKGYTPILAHPERYLYYIENETIFTQMKNKGVKLQLNALSLCSYYGPEIKYKASQLLKNGLYDFIGLDTHKTKHLSVLESIKIPKKNVRAVEKLITNNKLLF